MPSPPRRIPPSHPLLLPSALLDIRVFAVRPRPAPRPSPPPRRPVSRQVAGGDRPRRVGGGGRGVSLALLRRRRQSSRRRRRRVVVPAVVRVPRIRMDADARRRDRGARAVALPRRARMLVAPGVPPRSGIAPGGGGGGGGEDDGSQFGVLWLCASSPSSAAAVADRARTETPPPIAGGDAHTTDAPVPRVTPRRRGPSVDGGARSGRRAAGGGGGLPRVPPPSPPGRAPSGRRRRRRRRRPPSRGAVPRLGVVDRPALLRRGAPAPPARAGPESPARREVERGRNVSNFPGSDGAVDVHDALRGLRLPRLRQDRIFGRGRGRPRRVQLDGIAGFRPLRRSGVDLARLSLARRGDVPRRHMALRDGIRFPCNLPGGERAAVAPVSGGGGWTLVFAIRRSAMNGLSTGYVPS